MILLVAYDLRQPGRDYSPVTAALRSAPGWAHVQGSVWLLDTAETAEQWLDRLTPQVDANDSIFVARLQRNWWSKSLSDDVLRWLHDPARTW
jgi:CRISPR/Cas system-associated endoribonuclease Cas2